MSQVIAPIPTRRVRRALICLAVSAAAATPGAAHASSAPVAPAFAGSALWVTSTAGKSGLVLAGEASRAGARSLYVKAADGSTAEPQFSSSLVSEIRSAGTRVCAWSFMYGLNPAAEAAVAAAAVKGGAQCLVVDAEGSGGVPNLYGAAQVFVRTLRAKVGRSFPIGLASQAEVAEHPAFPSSVFLGPGAFDVVLPLMYWLDFGQSVDGAYAATMRGNSIYGRPILPVGQLYGAPKLTELQRFRALSAAYGSRGSSFFDLDIAEPEQLSTLSSAAPKLARRPLLAPTLRPGGDGDEIVQAQELLNGAGAHLPVGGFYGSQTARAVAAFQRRAHLRPDGILTPATWKALLRFRPREPSWASAPPDSAR